VYDCGEGDVVDFVDDVVYGYVGECCFVFVG